MLELKVNNVTGCSLIRQMVWFGTCSHVNCVDNTIPQLDILRYAFDLIAKGKHHLNALRLFSVLFSHAMCRLCLCFMTVINASASNELCLLDVGIHYMFSVIKFLRQPHINTNIGFSAVAKKSAY